MADQQQQQGQGQGQGQGQNPLPHEMWAAIEQGDLAKITSLIDGGLSIESVDDEGGALIMVALWKGKLEVAKLLLQKGADLSKVDNFGYTALHCAARGGDCGCILWLLDQNTIDIDISNNVGRTPIMIALRNGKLDAAKLLGERGANLFLKDNFGQIGTNFPLLNALSDGTLSLGPQVLEHIQTISARSETDSKHFLLLHAASKDITGERYEDASYVVGHALQEGLIANTIHSFLAWPYPLIVTDPLHWKSVEKLYLLSKDAMDGNERLEVMLAASNVEQGGFDVKRFMLEKVQKEVDAAAKILRSSLELESKKREVESKKRENEVLKEVVSGKEEEIERLGEEIAMLRAENVDLRKGDNTLDEDDEEKLV